MTRSGPVLERTPTGGVSERSRSTVLDLVRSSGSISRTELVELTGLTGASITRIVKALLDAGQLVETGLADSTGGKRRSLLELDARAATAVGLSLEPERLVWVLTDSTGRVLGRTETRGVGRQAPAAALPRIADDLRAFLSAQSVDVADVAALGVAGAGLDLGADAEGRTASALEWERFPVEEELARVVGLPVVRDNDASCAALGEFWTGRVPAAQDLATLYMSQGFGLGLVLGGRLARGASSNTGEIGHLTVQADGPACWCGATGCLEVVAGPRTVVARARSHADLAAALRLSGDDERLQHDFDAVAEAAAAGEERCLHLIRTSARFVASAVLSAVNLLDLDRVHLVGPGFRVAGDVYAEAARELVGRAARTRDVHPVTIELSDPGRDAAAIGAASLALQHVLTPHTRPSGPRRVPADV